jgi:hypothetical protein
MGEGAFPIQTDLVFSGISLQVISVQPVVVVDQVPINVARF